MQVGTYPTRNFATLWTVIVTAAVYRGFTFTASLALTAPLNLPALAGVRLYTAPCGFAQPCVFAKQLPWTYSLRLPLSRGGAFSRSYGASLPSSLTVNLSSALVSSTRPPVSVSGTQLTLPSNGGRGFSRESAPPGVVTAACGSCTVAVSPRLFLRLTSGYTLQRAIPSARTRFAPPSPLRLRHAGLRNIDRMFIRPTVSGLLLGPDLP